MKEWLRRIRGAVGMGLTWAAAWFGFGAIFWPFFGPTVVEVALGLAVTGLIGGAIFSLALAIAEGRRRFDEMSLPSFAVLGAVGGLFISLLFAILACAYRPTNGCLPQSDPGARLETIVQVPRLRLHRTGRRPLCDRGDGAGSGPGVPHVGGPGGRSGLAGRVDSGPCSCFCRTGISLH